MTALILVTLVSAALRLYGLGAESLSFDEAYPVQAAKGSIATILAHAPHDVHPPFYSFLLHYWIRLFGDGEFALRLLPALFGTALVPAVYFLARRLFGVPAALGAAIFAGLSGFNIFFSQECRQYSFMNLLSAVSYYYFVRLHLDKPCRSAVIGYLSVNALLLYTHSFGALVLLSQALFLFLRRPSAGNGKGLSGRQWAAAHAVLWTTFLPWALIALRNAAFVNSHFWTEAFTRQAFVTGMLEWAGGGKLAVLFAVFFTGALYALRRQVDRTGPMMMWLWVLTVIGVPFLLSVIGTPVYYKRYAVAMAVPLQILAASGLFALRGPRIRALLLVLWTLLALNNVRLGHQSSEHEQWREVVGAIAADARSGDLVIINSRGVPAYEYYMRRADLEVRVFPEMAYLTQFIYDWDHVAVTEQNIGQLASMTAERPRVWLIQSHHYDDQRLVERTLTASHRRIFRRPMTGITLSFFEK